jgi:predicted nucleic acid-binding protein
VAAEPEASALYLDTSALIKLYVEEAGADRVEGAVERAELVATSVVAYAEARAALARRHRENDFTASEYQGIVSELDASWQGYERLGVTEGLAREAGELAEEHALRGFDAVHLASALRLAQRFPSSSFLAFDERLTAAAERTWLSVL